MEERHKFLGTETGHGAEVPLGARVPTTSLSMITMAVLAICLLRRVQSVRKWSRLPIVSWLILAIYVDSVLFIFSTAVLNKSWSINDSTTLCQAAILLCLTCYMTTKILIYYFLVEKVYIVRGSTARRMRDKLWCFNVFGVILPFAVLVVVNFIFRIAYINDQGVCLIGMERKVLFPLIGFDAMLNIWLTSLFLHPLYRLYSFKNNANPALRTMAIRTFVGSCATLLSSVVNLTVLAVLQGEPGWICLMLCNLDILFSVLVLHWATAVAKQESSTTYVDRAYNAPGTYGNGTHGKSQRDETRMSYKNSATITTAITARDRGSVEDIESLEGAKSDHAIVVQTVRTVQHEAGPGADNAEDCITPVDSEKQ